MTRFSTCVAAAAVVNLVALSAPLCAPVSGQSVPVRAPQTTLARVGQGSIHGLVLDVKGRPLAGAMVSALGSTVAFALTNRDGRFLIESLPPGAYAVRIHLDGFVPAPRQLVDVRLSSPSIVSVALRALGEAGASSVGTPILTAGVLPLEGAIVAADGVADGETDQSETAWRLRHVKRSVLKSVDEPAERADGRGATGDGPGRSFLGRAFHSSKGFASALFEDLPPFTGQVNLITTGTFDSPSELWSNGALAAASVAYVSLGAPVGRAGDWAVRGAVTQGSLGSWFVAGSLTARSTASHRYVTGLSYSAQRYDQTNPVALAAIRTGSRALGTLYAFDEWSVSPIVTIGYGLGYTWQDYLSDNGLVSPRVSVTLKPAAGLRLQTIMARRASAPGADEFQPRTSARDAMWLPAQRSFSPWSEKSGFRAQRTDHLEVSVERDVDAYIVGFRTFVQRVDDQSGALFAAATPDHPAASPGHYYVAALGDVEARGWSVSVSRPIAGGVRGSVDYSQTTTRWRSGPDAAAMGWWPGGRRTDVERLHDLTTSVETDISPTATRVYVLYKFNSGFSRPDANGENAGFDTRFDVQVNQSLPFLNFTSADWEVLVSVCNLFRETTGYRSVYDELLVMRPPKRVVGGVRVRF